MVQELNEGNNYTDKHFTQGIENAGMNGLKRLCGTSSRVSKQGIALHSKRSLCNCLSHLSAVSAHKRG